MQLSLFDPIEIPLTQGQVTLISPEDADLALFGWHARKQHSGGYYAVRHIYGDNMHCLRLHRVVMERMIGRELEASEEVDHIDLNKLNNQRSNLRLATKTQNSRNKGIRKNNTSGCSGVHWNKRRQKWVVFIYVDCKRLHLGYFDDFEKAKQTRREAAIKYHGEFARIDG